MIRFNATKLAAVSVAQSAEQTRYYLCGVYLIGKTAVAADGHTMTVARDDDASNDAPGIYPVSKKARAAMKRGKIVMIDNGVLRVIDRRDSILHMEPCAPIDGTFPDWTRFIPSGEMRPTSAAFGARVLAALAETATILDNCDCAISINAPDGNPVRPHVIRYSDQPDVFSVAMPMRSDGVTVVPNWIVDASEVSTADDAA